MFFFLCACLFLWYDEENKKRYAMEEKMLEEYRTIYQGGEGELIEKKSRFIATVRLVKSEEEALAFIE